MTALSTLIVLYRICLWLPYTLGPHPHLNLSIKKNIAWEGVANPPYAKTAKNLPMTYKKHYYNGGPFRFVKSLDTNTQITILLLQYEDYL